MTVGLNRQARATRGRVFGLLVSAKQGAENLGIRQVFFILLVVQLFSIGLRETLDPDMWWHLRTGEFIWHHGIPHHDVFSFTARDHEWITHEWLSEALMWPVYVIGGLPALSAAFALLGALAFWLVYSCSDGKPYLAGLLVLLGSLTASPSVGVRPQMFDLVLTAAFVRVLESFKAGEIGRRTLSWLPVLAILWVNLHGGYLLGPVVLLVYAGGETMELLIGDQVHSRLSWTDVRWLLLLALLCLLAGVVNPNGWRMWAYPFGTLGSPAMQQNIAEWRSPDFHDYAYWPFVVMLGLGAMSWTFAPTRPCWTDLLLFFGTGAAGLVSLRHIALFGIIGTPVIARSLAASLRGTKAWALLAAQNRQGQMTRRKVVLNWAILLLGILSTSAWQAAKLAKNEARIASTYPVAAVDFLRREGLAARHGYNPYAWGGYLIWRGIPVFVDGRADVYGDHFLSYYFKTLRLTDEWRKPLDDVNVAYVLLERSNPLGTLLVASGAWHEVYADDVARVFVRSGAST
jgi:hypothetical protein